jgi:D-alanyl-D-alanine carboxypeptidase
VVGAIGQSATRVPATRDMSVRVGNVGETMTTTVLLQLVDQGRISFDDPVTRWLPSLRGARGVTVGMLARSTSGWRHIYALPAFQTAYLANPFRVWTTSELIDVGVSAPRQFPPGTSWAFSDTGHLVLARILERVGGAPMAEQLRRRIIRPLGLRSTAMVSSAGMPNPPLHGYTSERGRYEEATFWDPSAFASIANVVSRLDDLGRWARALGTGALLTRASFETRLAPVTVGLGPNRADLYYGVGVGVNRGWVVTNPSIPGYTGIVAHLPARDLSIVVVATETRGADPAAHLATRMYRPMGRILAPEAPPTLPG